MIPIRAIAATGALLWLAACTPVGANRPPPSNGASSLPSTEPLPADPLPAEEAPRHSSEAPPPVPPPRPPELAAISPPPVGRPGDSGRPLLQLVGLNASQLLDEMGEPDHVLRQPPATVWRYLLAGCAIDMFLFRDLESEALKTLSFAVTSTRLPPGEAEHWRCSERGSGKSDG